MTATARSLAAALRSSLRAGEPLSTLTVLAPDNDPFRVDAARKRKAGEWLAARLAEIDALSYKPRWHLRGLHYRLLDLQAVMPNGQRYVSSHACWQWLQGDAAKGARWLGLIDGDRIRDARNAEPRWREATPIASGDLDVTLGVDLFRDDDMTPSVVVEGFTSQQLYRIALVAEKDSAYDVLDPIADEYNCDLYMPTGEITDTQIRQMASLAVNDARPLIVIDFSDADPSGWQMPISIARKLQACKALDMPTLQFKVIRAALTPAQVREFKLADAPLNPNEKRANAWTAATGLAQTELDALASSRPELLERIARDAIEPWYDTTLTQRVRQARAQWLRDAQAVIDAAIRNDVRHAELAEAAANAIAALSEYSASITNRVTLPDPPRVPLAVLDPERETPPLLCDSSDDFRTQCLKLIASKAYADQLNP